MALVGDLTIIRVELGVTTGCSLLGSGCSTLGCGCSTLGCSCSTLGSGSSVVGALMFCLLLCMIVSCCFGGGSGTGLVSPGLKSSFILLMAWNCPVPFVLLCCLMVFTRFSNACMTVSLGVTVGCVMYLCLKNSAPVIHRVFVAFTYTSWQR